MLEHEVEIFRRATWIEWIHHCRRRERGLGEMTPVEHDAVFRPIDGALVAA